MDESGAIHGLDRGGDLSEGSQFASQHAQTIAVRGRRCHAELLAVLGENAHVKPGSTQVECNVHHISGPPWKFGSC